MTTNPQKMAQEKRRGRLRAELRVYYGPSQNMVLYGFSVDISCGGLFLKTETPFSVAEMLLLSFTLPEGKTIACKARVAWVNLKEKPIKPKLPTGAGIQFVDIHKDYQDSINDILEHHVIEVACQC